MWNVTAVVDAKPVINLGVAFAGMTCFKSKPKTEFAPIDTVGITFTLSIKIVAVDVEAAVFEITIFVTTVVVDVFGTV
jgi:hypothetical protein